MFNIAYLAGILVFLVAWNSLFLGYVATGFSFPIQEICMGGLRPTNGFTGAPFFIGMTFLALGIIYVAIIRSSFYVLIRNTKLPLAGEPGSTLTS